MTEEKSTLSFAKNVLVSIELKEVSCLRLVRVGDTCNNYLNSDVPRISDNIMNTVSLYYVWRIILHTVSLYIYILDDPRPRADDDRSRWE